MRLLLLPAFLLRDLGRRMRGAGQSAVPLWQEPYRGGPVAMVALYQNGRPRPDMLALMLALRRRGVYVVAVNAGALASGGVRLPADCYVERRNFGRDFGSYRCGVRLVRKIAPGLDRLLLLNDSVFWVSSGLDGFIGRLLGSGRDICSATESTELRPHLTSFCLSFSGRCFRHPSFRRFWDRYIPTDLRPATVLLGEIGLSRHMERAGFSRETVASREVVRQAVLKEPGLAALPGRAAGGEAAADWCVAGNVTHRAPAALLELGVPLVKLDLEDRAALGESCMAGVGACLPEEDRLAFAEIMAQKRQNLGRPNRLDQLGARYGLS
ncbi:hypothetical protein [Mangrovicoccus ximenensis]|uniref:hypothetical protein n=1 Tax=Mangrovicoccus ximenensis TaxID=1911570 RepID=UPI000D39B2D1|nr:hypothetical protein [Mangrovicoccus ximenensis]